MFVPPYQLIEPHIKAVPSARGRTEQVTIPTELFRFLLRCALAGCEFDEAQYRRCNPDVADAVEQRSVASGREHFLGKGYFERRVGAVPVHEAWYLSHNPDVAEAKRTRMEESGEAHYRRIGICEWREPDPGCASAVRAWKQMLSRLGTPAAPVLDGAHV